MQNTPESQPFAATFSLEDVLAATQAKVYNPQHSPFQSPFAPASLSTDARNLLPGQWFVPLVGERFDGHDFRAQAYERGAVASLMQADKAPLMQNAPNQCIVSNTLWAYQQLGQFHRRRVNPIVIGITGSSGKTTTKTLLHAGLSTVYTAQCTQKNFNNDVGVAQTLLSIAPETQLAIVEMGMRGLGEIARLTLTAEPNVGVITNIGPAHIERLGSIEAIAQAKCELAQGLNPQAGTMVVNGDDALLMATLATVWPPARTQTVKLTDATEVQPTANGSGVRFMAYGVRVQLPVPGPHMIMNALLVLKVAQVLGKPLAPVAEGLATYQPEAGRYSLMPIAATTHVVQDAYNANPDSMQASITAFLQQPTPLPNQRKAMVLAGMNELGPLSAHYHQQLGQWLLPAITPLRWLLLIGPDCQPTAHALAQQPTPVHWVATTAEAQQWLATQALEDTFILCKGSRSYQLEQLWMLTSIPVA
jgi:UDP-N-acetylmuramoyl-tripeptide--D-alanyl-D-alanine ligase